jgi:hypothetical protein
VKGVAVDRWYQVLTGEKGLSQGTAVRHFNVMRHMMQKGVNDLVRRYRYRPGPVDEVEVMRPDDQRERYLDAEEISKLKAAVDDNGI